MGEVHWRRADGTTGEYVGPVQELGQGIPRRDHGPGVRRALFDLAFGYVSGFPVRDILAYVFPGSFREAPVLEAEVQALDTEEGEPTLRATTDGIERANQELARFGLRSATEGRCLTCPGGHGRHKVGGKYPELPHEVIVETEPENEDAP